MIIQLRFILSNRVSVLPEILQKTGKENQWFGEVDTKCCAAFVQGVQRAGSACCGHPGLNWVSKRREPFSRYLRRRAGNEYQEDQTRSRHQDDFVTLCFKRFKTNRNLRADKPTGLLIGQRNA
jgi:hypothetical protein